MASRNGKPCKFCRGGGLVVFRVRCVSGGTRLKSVRCACPAAKGKVAR